MADAPDDALGRRKFLGGMAAGTAGFMATPPIASAQDPGHQAVPSDIALRVKALESLLVEKGMIDPATIDAVIETYESKVGPRNGARVVARAWTDAAFRKRLLSDGTAAIAELGYGGAQGEHMVVVENHAERPQPGRVHVVLVLSVAGARLPPTGTSPRRIVRGPSSTTRRLREFGVALPDGVEVRVWDSTAEIRYLVLPERRRERRA
jgi:nitrile hydratase